MRALASYRTFPHRSSPFWLSHEGEGGLASLPLDAEQFEVAYGIAFGLKLCRRVAAAIFATKALRRYALKPRQVDQVEDRIGLAARHGLAELDAGVGLDRKRCFGATFRE
ncbi:hypothetical protein [Mesorhizobium album]|uniref:hypothetical protein n=1 Tax=Mesorhizobium album TaxID=3072314 RepID=UPI002A24DFED|nr:hypothetical protein [Mesorhizobium sp. VK24D]